MSEIEQGGDMGGVKESKFISLPSPEKFGLPDEIKIDPPFYEVGQVSLTSGHPSDIQASYKFRNKNDAEAYIQALKDNGFKGRVSFGKFESAGSGALAPKDAEVFDI